jgi:hypothetical protein
MCTAHLSICPHSLNKGDSSQATVKHRSDLQSPQKTKLTNAKIIREISDNNSL